ncbi:MAG: prenyltransferase [Deltaproteobacteria bacterium]|nr:prenyltransferase [Deltaproteobacteria bacterium]
MVERASTLRAWLRAARPLAQANIAVPLVFGQALAVAHGARFDPWICVLVHVFGVLDQLVIVFANDVADEAGDRLHRAPTPFSGGSRVLVDGLLDAPRLRAAAIAAAIALVGHAGLLASVWHRPLALVAAGAALLLLLAYSYGPLRLSYRGGGELAQGLGLGAVLPAFAYAMQAGSLDGLSPLMLLPTILLGIAGNIVTALPDEPADRLADKRSWPVRVGVRVARKHALLVTALAILCTPLVLGDDATPERLFATEAPALALLAVAALTWRSALVERRRECIAFVVAAAGAGSLAMLAWSVSLLWR